MEHKYITCTGYGGTGSSVISDLMKEFQIVKSCGADFEITLAFDYNGISDLQHYIVDDFERNKVSEGIYYFRKHIKNIARMYDRNLSVDIEEVTNDYINKLIDVVWLGFTVHHMYRYPRWKRILLYRIPSYLQSLVFKYKDDYEHTARFKYRLPIEVSYGKEKFFEETKQMYRRLLSSFDQDKQYEYLCFDQLVPAYNFERYLNYFPNLKVIVVDRDPRDLYLLNELYWHEGWIPSYDIDLFIKWFKLIREERKNLHQNNENVLFVNFEESIFNYESFVKKITAFLGISSKYHVYPKKYFNPEVSHKNARLWLNNCSKEQQILKIENELACYCYNELKG